MAKNSWGKYNQAQRNLWSAYKRRGLQLTYEEFLSLTSLNCYYCDSEPKNVRVVKSHFYVYSGLDRKDPKGGYVIGNVVPCCWTCNKMKSNMTHDQFLVHIDQILNCVKK